MKILFLIVVAFILLCQACSNEADQKSQVNSITEEIALNFDTEELYKELIRRSSKLPLPKPHISLDSIPSLRDFDTLRDEADTILKPSESDTVMLTSLKHRLSKYSDRSLFAAYNEILKRRAENKGAYVQYGEDNRIEVNDDLSPNYLASSKCVFAIIEKKYFTKKGGIFSVMSKGRYSRVYKLCDEEKYGEQELFAKCSAFAISDNKVATASHCVDRMNYDKYFLVTDFTIDKIKYYRSNGIPESNVFEITQVVELAKDKKDYSILLVDKTISENRIAKLSKKAAYTADDYFYVIGFPCGLPMKICNSANLRQDSHPYYFQINSDTYGGNSGSPVFNKQTNEVEGILVRGNDDFFFEVNNCRSSIKCPDYGCRGEDVTRVDLIRKFSKEFH